MGVGDQLPHHPHQVHLPLSQQPLRQLGAVDTTYADHRQLNQLLDPRGAMGELSRLVVVGGPVGAGSGGVGEGADPHVDVVQQPCGLQQGRHSLEVLVVDAVLHQVVAYPNAQQQVGPQGGARRLEDLVQERHPLLKSVAAVPVGAAVALAVEELGHQAAIAHNYLDAVQASFPCPCDRRTEGGDHLLRLLGAHLVGHGLDVAE